MKWYWWKSQKNFYIFVFCRTKFSKHRSTNGKDSINHFISAPSGDARCHTGWHILVFIFPILIHKRSYPNQTVNIFRIFINKIKIYILIICYQFNIKCVVKFTSYSYYWYKYRSIIAFDRKCNHLAVGVPTYLLVNKLDVDNFNRKREI